MNVDLNHYKVFFIVSKHKNISRAAESLYISQPAVSKSIKTLETSLGITLFSRHSKGVTLTNEGLILYKYIERAFNEISLGEDILNKLKNKEIGTINLGVSAILGKYYLLPKLNKFIKKFPKFKIHINNTHTEDELELIRINKLELAIVSQPIHDDMIEFIKLEKINDIFVASDKYLKQNSILNTNDLFSKGSFMLLENSNVTRKHIDNYFYNNGLSITPDIEASNMDFLIECAEIGLGITSTPITFVEKSLKDGLLIQIPVVPPIPSRFVGVAYKKHSTLSIAAEELIYFLKEST